MSLLAVGSVAFDDLETPSGRRENVLGGSATYFSLSASHFTPVAIVAVVGEDFGPEQMKVFEGKPIDLQGLDRAKGKSFRWKGAYGQDLNTATTLDTQLNVFADFHPNLPEATRRCPFLFLGNIAPGLQLNVVNQMAQRPRWIALDTMNFWIEGDREALFEVLKAIDILLVNEAEARAISGERNLVKACRAIQTLGPRIVVVKRGEYGAVLAAPEGLFMAPAYPLEDVCDPTGAGDTFAGGFLGHLASTGSLSLEDLKEALLRGTVMASFTVEAFGTERLAAVTQAQIQERLAAFKAMIRPSGI
ncbi:MAG: PfkB family carbohydrate kinase [Firmicutes bacterium]|nr:PfkB family carbohydrate kinase [Bacillota bacterium]